MNRPITVVKIQKTKPVEMDQIVEVFDFKCQNKSYECSLPVEEGHKHCIKHILQAPTTKYKQCSYIYSNGKQCTQAKLVEERTDPNFSTFCIEHTRLNQINKTKSLIGTFKHMDSTETLVHSLTHHVKIDKIKPQSTTKITPFDEDEEIDVVTPTVDPFFDINASEILNRGKNILDFASDSSSDEDPPTTLFNTWRSHELDNSDDESVDSSDDVLKHAGVYTVDEVVAISKEKMQSLQSLYIDQFQRLQYVLREKRRQHLHDLKKEKETLSSIHDQIKDSPKERKLYQNLKAMNHYHRRYGVEAILHRQYLEKRQKQNETISMAAPTLVLQKNIPKCTYIEGGVKCNERSIPCCKYCRKHILEDKKQILFKACSIEKSGIVCQDPVVNIFEDSACVLHTSFPIPKSYMKRKYESETEEEESDTSKVNIKKEYLDIEMDITTSELPNDCIVNESEKTTQEDDVIPEPSSTEEVIVA
ncbi:CLUMA_CG000002, isoform A [Clunio marinus]|uniref:KAT8 regulatory NSL complex subunit 2 n=1 Tax=Clunio marinus TaxID=568069 RepID=A0A1J1HIZ3_9DIPT|nr:CLUMA_CG000002, isoform A [Clunio marinus]